MRAAMDTALSVIKDQKTGVTSKSLCELMGISNQYALKLLVALCKEGAIKQVGREEKRGSGGRAIVFSLEVQDQSIMQQGANAAVSGAKPSRCPYGALNLKERCMWMAGYNDKLAEIA